MSMSTASPYTYNWFDGTSLTSMYIDHIESWWEPGASWHALNQREFACAIQNGLISAHDDAFADWLGLLADFEPMWVEGYSTMTWDEAYRLFITGKVPFLLGNAASQTLNVTRDADFNWGISYFPPSLKPPALTCRQQRERLSGWWLHRWLHRDRPRPA